MMTLNKISRATLGSALAAVLAAGFAATMPGPAVAQPAGAVAPDNQVTLSVGTGQLVQLRGTMSDVFIANEGIADVQVRSANQIYIFGKAPGQTTVYATDRGGRVVYSANVRVGQNLASIGDMLQLAMPEADIQATPMSGLILLTGTVAQPSDAEEAERLAQAFVGEGTQVVSRLRTATPQQVMLQVKIAEVSRTYLQNIGVNLLTQDTTGGFQFGVAQGEGINVDTGAVIRQPLGTTFRLAGELLGLDIVSGINLAEQNGHATTLAEPTLTALSGETASFLAGGEFPIPVSQSLGTVTVEYKEFGVGLAFTPYVLEDGRISMRVRPEVSELSSAGSITLNGFEVPSLTTRRAETTVELGSGQSFMIAGLLRNTGNNNVDRAPFLGNLPIIGALFRSNRFRREETELVIVVTPYLVQPVSSGRIALPTDGYRTPDDAQRILGGMAHDSRTGAARPQPQAGPPQTVTPGIGGISEGRAPSAPAAPAAVQQTAAALPPQQASGPAAQPGFDF